MPVVADPPPTPLTAHVTEVFMFPVTVAAKDWVFERSTVAVEGATVTCTCDGEVSVTVAWPNAEELAADVARIVTVGEAGMVAGAV